jgi:hypothetical protein
MKSIIASGEDTRQTSGTSFIDKSARSAKHILGIRRSAIVEEIGSWRQSYVERTVRANSVIYHRKSDAFSRLTPRGVGETSSRFENAMRLCRGPAWIGNVGQTESINDCIELSIRKRKRLRITFDKPDAWTRLLR